MKKYYTYIGVLCIVTFVTMQVLYNIFEIGRIYMILEKLGIVILCFLVLFSACKRTPAIVRSLVCYFTVLFLISLCNQFHESEISFLQRLLLNIWVPIYFYLRDKK